MFWRMRQIQDSYDYIKLARTALFELLEEKTEIQSEEDLTEIVHILNHNIHRAFACLTTVPAQTRSSLVAQCFNPPLDPDLGVFFHVLDSKLIVRVTHHKHSKDYEEHEYSCTLEWLSEVQLLISVAQQILQHQLNDKVRTAYCSSPCLNLDSRSVLFNLPAKYFARLEGYVPR